MEIAILHQDDHIIVVNKPHGLLVHRSKIAADAEEFLVQLLRDQIDQYVYPVHRLDRKTAGAMVFGLTKEAAQSLTLQLTNRTVCKKYRAIVRGYFPAVPISLDYALANDRGNMKEAITDFRLIDQTEIAVPFGKYATSRYSIVEAMPKTGRTHQIRRHLAHLRHPIIADRPHGCNKQNRLFKERWDMTTMMLHARELEIDHPSSGERMIFIAPYSTAFLDTARLLDFTSL